MPDDHDFTDLPDFADDESGDEPGDEAQSVRALYAAPLRRAVLDILRTTRTLVQLADLPGFCAPAGPGPAPDLADADATLLAAATAPFMLENAHLLVGKLAAASGTTDYGQLLELAVRVKVAACELLAQTNLLRRLPQLPGAYLDALRADIDAFRLLFGPWVASFDPTDHHDDGWGLFRPLLPPGAE